MNDDKMTFQQLYKKEWFLMIGTKVKYKVFEWQITRIKWVAFS